MSSDREAPRPFPFARRTAAEPREAAALRTPLGTFDLTFRTEAEAVGGVAPRADHLPPAAYVLTWPTAALDVELLLTPFRLAWFADPGKDIRGALAGMWRVRAR
jgi:hypothetical protein